MLLLELAELCEASFGLIRVARDALVLVGDLRERVVDVREHLGADLRGRKPIDGPPGVVADHALAVCRGCGECRREDYVRFKAAWVRANPRLDLTVATPIEKIDLILQRDQR